MNIKLPFAFSYATWVRKVDWGYELGHETIILLSLSLFFFFTYFFIIIKGKTILYFNLILFLN